MSLQTILVSLGALLSPITNIGLVYTYDRMAVQPEQVRAVFGFTDATFSKGWSIRAWMLDRVSTEEQRLTNRDTLRRHTIRLQGYWEVNDAAGSRTAFRTLCETVLTTLRATYQLVPDAELVEPPQVVEDGAAILGETYHAHSIEITFVIQELVTP